MVSIFAIIGIALLGWFVLNPGIDLAGTLGFIGSGMTYAVMSVVGDVEYLSDRETTGNQLAYKVYLLDVRQIDPDQTYPTANASGEIGTIPLLTGQYWHYFEAVDNTLNDKTSGQKGDVTTDVTNTFDFIMGGNLQALMYFLRQHAGGKFLIAYYDVGDACYKLLGSNTKPMVLQGYERKNDKEGKYLTLTFQNKWFDMQWIYTGNLTTETPVTIAADATTMAITDNPTYQLTTGSASAVTINAVSGLASADVGRVIDVLGSGGTYPSIIADNSVFVLTDAGSWTANAGSRISFKILGTATLVEVLGTRVQTA